MLEYQITHIVGDCHKEVFDYVVSKLRGQKATYDALPEDYKVEFMNTCRKAHNENRKIYAAVMQKPVHSTTERKNDEKRARNRGLSHLQRIYRRGLRYSRTI